MWGTLVTGFSLDKVYNNRWPSIHSDTQGKGDCSIACAEVNFNIRYNTGIININSFFMLIILMYEFMGN